MRVRLSDLHIDPTLPFILVWSSLNAFAFECTVPASDTAPVREVIETETTGMLSRFSMWMRSRPMRCVC